MHVDKATVSPYALESILPATRSGRWALDPQGTTSFSPLTGAAAAGDWRALAGAVLSLSKMIYVCHVV